MADEAEDVLELETFEEVEDEDAGAAEPQDEPEGDEPEGEDEETIIGFDGEDEDEAAPASESDSSTFRELRRKLREKERELAELRRHVPQPARIELGPKPTLESCEYDEERFETELDAWKERKSKVDAEEAEAEAARKRQQEEWGQKAEAYKAAKSKLAVRDFDEAESEVFSVLSNDLQAAILFEPETAPALIYALSKSPGKLEELSKLNLFQAAKLLGKLEDKVKVEKRRKLPEPDKPVTGRTSIVSGDKELKRLEREAERTGDRTALIRYRRQMNAQG